MRAFIFRKKIWSSHKTLSFSTVISRRKKYTMVATMPEPKKVGLFARFRHGKKNKADDFVAPEPDTINRKTESPTMVDDVDSVLDNSKNNAGINSGDVSQLKAVRFPANDALKTAPGRFRRELQKPPTAREAAYGGPPRYDWIDIETSAAIKVQSVVRRNQTMKHLEQQGITTAAIRNRSRRREARMNQRGVAGSGDIPNLLACCGVGLAFGEATEETYQATREHEKEEYLDRKKQKEAKEEELRIQFQKLSAKKKTAAARRDDVEEVVEVIEDNDE